MRDYKKHVQKSVTNYINREMDSNMLSAPELEKIMRDMGVSSSVATIRYWKQGKRLPNITQLLLLADLFGTSTDEIVGAYDKHFYKGETK